MVEPHVQKTLADLQHKVEEMHQEYVQAMKNANAFCAMFNEALMYPDVEDETTASGRGLRLRADFFADFSSPAAAVRALLKESGKERGALTEDEIFETLQECGYGFDHRAKEATQRGGLRIAVGKDKSLIKLGNGVIGLVEWYPHRKRPSGKKAVDNSTTEEAGEADDGAEADAAPNEAGLPGEGSD